MENLEHIFNHFNILNGKITITELDSGLINRTFKLVLEKTQKSYILQKINTNIFSDYDNLMNNIIKVSKHINRKLENNKINDYKNSQLYYSDDKKPYFKDKDGAIWRLSDYIENSSPNLNNKSNIAEESGKIIAKFHLLTNDLPIKNINETIPDFHNIKLRWKKLIDVTNEKPKRLNDTISLFNKIVSFEYLVNEYDKIVNINSLPVKIVHNDPKLSNILFENNKAISLIDPDTIMPGYLPIDFGDAIRSLCNTSDENETNLNKVGFDFSAFQMFSKSYLEIMKTYLTFDEVSALTIFPLIITLEQLIRFYTDYLEGDVYYQVQYPQQNLNRSKVQFKLLDSMHKKTDEISDYIFSIYTTYLR